MENDSEMTSTSNSIDVEQRLLELSIVLPPPPQPSGRYLPFVRVAEFVQMSGVAPIENGTYAVTGKLGRDLCLSDGVRGAELCAKNALANLKLACRGDLSRVNKLVMLRGFVNAAEEFAKVPTIIDGASDLLVQVFGTRAGSHARTSIGCASLPGNVAVEIDLLASVSID